MLRLVCLVVLASSAFAIIDFEKLQKIGSAELEKEISAAYAQIQSLGVPVSSPTLHSTSSKPQLRLKLSDACTTKMNEIKNNPSAGVCSSGSNNFDMSEVTKMNAWNQNQTAMFCTNPCTGMIISMVQEFTEACKSDIQGALSQTPGTSPPSQEDQQALLGLLLTWAVGQMYDMACLMNGDGQYCLPIMTELGGNAQSGSGSTGGGMNMGMGQVTQAQCAAAQKAGCCLGQYLKKAQDMMSMTGQTMPPQVEQQMKDGFKQACNVEFSFGCNVARAKLSGSISVGGLTWAMYQGLTAAKKKLTMQALVADCASHVGVAPTQFKNVMFMEKKTRESGTMASYDLEAPSTESLAKIKTKLTAAPISLPTVKNAASLTTTPSASVEAGEVQTVALPNSSDKTGAASGLMANLLLVSALVLAAVAALF